MSAIEGTQALFEAVRRVRNNLFHGGKYPLEPVAEPARNKALMNACLFILKEALKKCSAQQDGKLKRVHDEFNAPPNPPPSGLETP